MTQENVAASPDIRRIVLIEDDEIFRHSVTQTLETAGFRVFSFEQAKPALERITTLQPDAVLTDLFLGEGSEMNGLDVLEHVKEAYPELPLVLMTARANIPTAVQAIRGGAYDFLEKPFDKDRVVGLLTRATEQRRLTLENKSLKEQLAFASG